MYVFAGLMLANSAASKLSIYKKVEGVSDQTKQAEPPEPS